MGQGDGEGVMAPLASVSSTSVLPCATHSPDARFSSTWSSPDAITLTELLNEYKVLGSSRDFFPMEILKNSYCS